MSPSHPRKGKFTAFKQGGRAGVSSSKPSSSAEQQELPPFYYLENFLSLMTGVYSLYDDLLSPEEKSFYDSILGLTREAQALFVRLLGRRGNRFRLSKLSYSEITNLQAAVRQLEIAGLVEHLDCASVEDLFPLFSKAEWLSFLRLHEERRALSSAQKKELRPIVESRITQVAASEKAATRRILNTFNENIIQLNLVEVFSTFKLLYFGNGRQDLTEFVLRDLGVYQFENYKLDKQNRLFDRRSQIEEMLFYYGVRASLEDIATLSGEELVALHRSLPFLKAAHCTSPIADRAINKRMQSLRISLARQLERLKYFDEALSIYAECCVPPSRERRVRILAKLDRPVEALILCESLLSSDNEAERIFARQFISRLKRKLPSAHKKKLTGGRDDNKHFESPSAKLRLPLIQDVSVEQAVVEHYSKTGECYYLENQLFLTVFALVFWPVLFAGTRGAFSHEFQRAPHDLYEDDFLLSRNREYQHALDRLVLWSRKPEKLLCFAKKKQGIANAFVHWESMREHIFRRAMERIPLAHWQAVFKRMWKALRENRNGFPDVVYFPPEGGYELIEVKGPGDRLQANQKRWLAYFEEQKIPCKVLYIEWIKN